MFEKYLEKLNEELQAYEEETDVNPELLGRLYKAQKEMQGR